MKWFYSLYPIINYLSLNGIVQHHFWRTYSSQGVPRNPVGKIRKFQGVTSTPWNGNSSWGGGSTAKVPSVGEVWIFPGTTQCRLIAADDWRQSVSALSKQAYQIDWVPKTTTHGNAVKRKMLKKVSATLWWYFFYYLRLLLVLYLLRQ